MPRPAKGTHTGDRGGWTAQDEAVELPGVWIYEFEEGLFREKRMSFDNNPMAANRKPPSARDPAEVAYLAAGDPAAATRRARTSSTTTPSPGVDALTGLRSSSASRD